MHVCVCDRAQIFLMTINKTPFCYFGDGSLIRDKNIFFLFLLLFRLRARGDGTRGVFIFREKIRKITPNSGPRYVQGRTARVNTQRNEFNMTRPCFSSFLFRLMVCFFFFFWFIWRSFFLCSSSIFHWFFRSLVRVQLEQIVAASPRTRVLRPW